MLLNAPSKCYCGLNSANIQITKILPQLSSSLCRPDTTLANTDDVNWQLKFNKNCNTCDAMWDRDSMGDPLLSHQQYYQLDHYFITDHSMQAHFLCGLNDVIIKSFIINDIYNLIKGRECRLNKSPATVMARYQFR